MSSTEGAFLKNYKKKLFSFLQIKDLTPRTHSIDLMKKSKQLTLNTTNYTSYSDYYKKLTTIHSFKLPHITSYPIQKNRTIISLIQVVPRKEAPKKDKNFSYLKTETSPLTTLESKTDDVGERTLMKYIDIFNNKNSVIHNYISYKQKYFINKNKDNGLSSLESLLEADFGKISKKVSSFDICSGKINVKMVYESLKMGFYDENDNKVSTIKVPFELLPLLFGLTYTDYKHFLSLVVDYDRKEKKFRLNDEKVKKYKFVFMKGKNLFSNKSIFYQATKVKSSGSKTQRNIKWIVLDENNNHSTFTARIIPASMRFVLKKKFGTKVKINRISLPNEIAYFLTSDFKDWELFLLNSFCVFKEFRDIINQTLSLNSTVFKEKNTEIFLNGSSFFSSKNDINNEKYEFFLTKGGENRYNVIHSPMIKVCYSIDSNPINDYVSIFGLSCAQAIKLNQLSSNLDSIDIIKKSLDIKKEYESESKKAFVKKITLNLDRTLDVDQDFVKYIKLPSLMPGLAKSKLNVLMTGVFLEWVRYDSENDFENKFYMFTKEETKEILSLALPDWPKFVISLNKEIEAKSETKPLDDYLVFEIEKGENDLQVKRKTTSRTWLKKSLMGRSSHNVV